MSTETDGDGEAIVAVEVDERFHVTDEKAANWLVRKVIEQRTYRDRVRRGLRRVLAPR